MEVKTTSFLDELNARYKDLLPSQRIEQFYKEFDVNQVLVTSSFAANSAFFLHLFSKYGHSAQEIHFIDTRFHFDETLHYKQFLSQKYNLNVVDITPNKAQNQAANKEQLWKTNPDLCCEINKVQPLSIVAKNYAVWASGLMRSQNEHRKSLRIFEEKKGNLRFYPIIDIDPAKRDAFIKQENLPTHPMVKEGYHSIGCKHCTVKGESREGRWVGLAKTECGLHI
ncbi:phosphoadenylyl-sulfate reductase [Psychroflexus planctonicus]|uniref:Adenosine 5'-phosphosulfate reductase n=1 Tax=Psychroflexus planctonicus TaxID=1526575 RepID=A0ABQ1SHZ9_9FLAO|nr:phosphoadenylyl-sulfate reductase [Psychroflexus planctonicus]GGE33108.1 phosphoadenylyl-sulfate reductase (thioredoxin) [Psychroflexus planctonicus]